MIAKAMKLTCALLLLAATAGAKELFDAADINAFMNEKNPYVYAAVGQRYVAQARAAAAEGAFDTRLGAKYDNKQYPTSDGTFTDVFVEKPTESGMQFLAGYRIAQGVQEYNNIKTGDEGEIRLGLKVPVFALAEGMNEQRYRLRSAQIESAQSGYVAEHNLRQLRFDVFSAYYTLLYRKQAAELETELLERARLRETYVKSRVAVGDLPEIAQLEVRRQVLNRRQRLLDAQNAYAVSLTAFLRFIGLSEAAFEAEYTLPPLREKSFDDVGFEKALRHAYEYRPDLKSLQSENRRFDLRDDYIAVEKYPRFNVSVYGVHDFVYDNGFKVSLDFSFPIERRNYYGKKSEILKGKQAVEEVLASKRIDIKAALSNRLTALRTLKQNMKNAEEEIAVAVQLEAAERKKFRLGSGNLVLVNQSELNTLEARMKKLSYALRLQLAGLEIQREAGAVIGGNALLASEAPVK